MGEPWRTADLTSYAAGSEADPHYRDLDEPGPPDRRTDQQRAADDTRSRAAWGLPPIDNDNTERSAA